MARVWKQSEVDDAEGEHSANGYSVDMTDHPVPGVRWLTDEEAHALFDKRAREALGISGDEFLRRWDAGEYDHLIDDPEHPEILQLAMMESFGR
jgi:hypothetical protein